MNEGENSVVPNSPNFSSPNISTGNNEELTAAVSAQETEKAITSEDISAMAGTTAGAVAVAAASMTESDAPEAVSSGAAITSNSSDDVASSRSRFGLSGRRFHANETKKSSAPVFAGAPDFFNQAASDIVINSPEEKKSKAPLFIGIGVVAAVIAVVVGIVLLAPKNVKSPAEKLVDLQAATEETIDSVKMFEGMVKQAKAGDIHLSTLNVSEDKYKQEKESIEGYLSKIKEYRKKLDDAKTININDENTGKNIKEYVDALIEVLDGRMSAYESAAKLYVALEYAYYTRGSNDAVSKLEASISEGGIKKVSSLVKNYYAKRKAYETQYSKECNSSNATTPTCSQLIVVMKQLDDTQKNDRSLAETLMNYYSGVDLEKNPTVHMDSLLKAKKAEEKND